jgi:predicted aconitase with swiveling domain
MGGKRLAVSGAPGLALRGRTLAPGSARGLVLVLDEPLSFWGGIDAKTGTIIDPRHPQAGASVAGRVLVMSSGRGSSSSSSVLAEAIRLGTAPAAVVLEDGDPILALGSLVAAELYGSRCPVIALDPGDYAAVVAWRELAVDASAPRATVQIIN